MTIFSGKMCVELCRNSVLMMQTRLSLILFETKVVLTNRMQGGTQQEKDNGLLCLVVSKLYGGWL